MRVGSISLFERMQDLRGFENLMVDMLSHKEQFHHLARAITDYNLKQIHRWSETAVDEVLISDDWGTQRRVMISPPLWEELFQPYYEEMCDAIHTSGKFVQMHSDGHILDIIPGIISCLSFTKSPVSRRIIAPGRDCS